MKKNSSFKTPMDHFLKVSLKCILYIILICFPILTQAYSVHIKGEYQWWPASGTSEPPYIYEVDAYDVPEGYVMTSCEWTYSNAKKLIPTVSFDKVWIVWSPSSPVHHIFANVLFQKQGENDIRLFSNSIYVFNNSLQPPGPISGSTVIACNSTNPITYSVPLIKDIDGHYPDEYIWQIPVGWTISGNAKGNSITVIPGATGTGDICVQSRNNHYQIISNPRCLNITRSIPAPYFTNNPPLSLCNPQGNVYYYTDGMLPDARASFSISSSDGGTAVLHGSLFAKKSIGVEFTSAGTFILSTFTTSDCGTSSTNSITIKVALSPPTSTPSVTFQESVGATLFTFRQPPRGDTFESSYNNSNFSSFIGSVTVLTGKPKKLYVRSVNNCGVGPAGMYDLISYSYSSVNEHLLDNDISIYPNPASDKVSIRINGKEAASYSITLYDLLGKKVADITKALPLGTNQSDMDVSYLTNGVYLLNITNGATTRTEKIIVNH